VQNNTRLKISPRYRNCFFLAWFQKAPKSPMTSFFAAQAMKSYNVKK
jgi:hypothetical protein